MKLKVEVDDILLRTETDSPPVVGSTFFNLIKGKIMQVVEVESAGIRVEICGESGKLWIPEQCLIDEYLVNLGQFGRGK